MKVLRGISVVIMGMWLVSCAEQYDANKRFVAERGVNKANNTEYPPGYNPEDGYYPGGDNTTQAV